MKVTCSGCKKVLNIPDEKIPDTGSVSFKCPSCKGTISVSKSDGGPPMDQTQDVALPPRGGVKGLPDMGGGLDHEIDMIGEGKYRALIADPGGATKISPALKKLDYQLTMVQSQEDGYKKLQNNTYDLILVNESFGGGDVNRNAIYKFLEPLPMEKRRKTFIILTGRSFKSMDEMAAFSHSADMVFNEGDYSNFELLLRKALNDFKNKYHTYRQILIDTGRAFD